MIKTTNAKARSFVQSMTPFKAANTFGMDINGVFVVFSYGQHFPLFANVAGVWYENTDRYSVTTSKHRSQLHPQVATVPLNTQLLKRTYA